MNDVVREGAKHIADGTPKLCSAGKHKAPEGAKFHVGKIVHCTVCGIALMAGNPPPGEGKKRMSKKERRKAKYAVQIDEQAVAKADATL